MSVQETLKLGKKRESLGYLNQVWPLSTPSQLSEMETHSRLLQPRTHGFLSPSPTWWAFLLVGTGLQHFLSCPKLLVAAAKFCRVQLRGRSSLLSPVLTCGMEVLPWLCATENTGDLIALVSTHKAVFPHKSRRPEITASHLLRVGSSLKKKCTVIPTSSPRPLASEILHGRSR